MIVFSILKGSGDLLTFRAAQRATEEAEVVLHPDNFLVQVTESQHFHFDARQATSLSDAVIQLVLIPTATKLEIQKVCRTDVLEELQGLL